MPNTYTQVFIQIVFAVKYRLRLVAPQWKDVLEQYITGIIRNKGHKLIRINCMPDHVHILVGMKPHESISDLVRDVKRDSTNYVNACGLARGRFAWQEGFGAFSYSLSEVNRVVQYIINQEAHHRRAGFREEYEGLLKRFGVDYEPRYAVRDPEE